MASQVKTSSISLSNYTTLINTLQNSGNADYKKLAQTILDTGLSKEEVEQYGLTKFGVNDALPSSYQLVQQMSSSLSTMNTALNGDTTTPGLATASRTIQAGLNNLDASISGGEYTNTDGSKTTITTEKSLKTGIKSYLAGTSQISGADQLADGANQISDGAGQLAAGSTTLGTGLTTLQDGANTLATSLHDGAEQVNSINSNDSTFDMLASPVDTSHKEISTVENNGHGMAPYMMSVGLYVACMAFTLMYPLFNDVEKAESGFKYWLSKASVWFTVSTIASIVMIASLMFFCDFAPQQLLMTFIFAVIVGAASMALVTLLSIVCGKIGEFVLLVFMVINLGGSAGTYPLETSSAIFKAIHPFMPFTYSVDGFRKVISMSNVSLNTEIIVFVGIIIICSLLTILVYNHRIKKPTPLIPQAFENVNE